ncbi:hypothetical protein [uncultured Alistipes sp.]|uniref:hypothetical protein n=1 Tax=uncultured Alistipes sp. TaxID=538949 RepID=UPI0025E053B1|nr:hypothetical protein [uncultured Alistipes sp.]
MKWFVVSSYVIDYGFEKLIGKTNARAAKMLKKREKDVSVCCISEKIRIFAVHLGQWK